MIIHVVQPGDTIYLISRRYGVPVSKIISDNKLTNPGRLVIGQTIVILATSIPYTVISGDSMYSIARKFGITLQELINANPQIPSPYRLIPGMVITVPLPSQKLGSMEVNGYATPDISLDLLQSVLPYLTYVSIFSYMVKADGSLTPINDTPIIQAARQARVAPMMVITNFIEGQGFDSDLGHTLLTDKAVQENMINNIIQTLRAKNYYGLDIDFEYLYPADRVNYNNFLRDISQRLNSIGYIVTTAIAPKLSADQPGLLYEAHDYPAHGRYANHVIIMTYEWGYIKGPAMAVSPIDQVQKVLDYAVTAIPSRKILMGMPNYGYDWTLPFVRGTTARTISNPGAVELAAQVGANIEYDSVSQAPFFRYYDSSGRQHEVWFDDARSVDARLRLVNKYNLGGVSYWTINRPFPQNWLVQRELYDTRKVL